MPKRTFLEIIQAEAQTFTEAVATDKGDWIVKGFIDVYRRIYTISVDTKVISKVFELLLFSRLKTLAEQEGYSIELAPQQNFYPDMTFTSDETGKRYALDIKSTYRTNNSTVNGMTLGAFTGYFRDRKSNKNILFPYSSYEEHIVLGIIYSKSEEITDEQAIHNIEDLDKIASVIKDFAFFAQPKYRIASSRPGSGNTKNIGSVTRIQQLINGMGPFSVLGEDKYDDYWMFYLTKDMAKAADTVRPYWDLKSYDEYKNRGLNVDADKLAYVEALDTGSEGEEV